MRNRAYINGIGSISIQPENVPFDQAAVEYRDNIIPAPDVNYKEFIKPALLRRMSKAVKMALSSGKMALKEAGLEKPDSIITGTGEGCKQDTEKFLSSLLDQNEKLLTPTSFIQSTHNTIGGQIALSLKCTGYNMTYTQNSCSLESALLDTKLQLQGDEDIRNILVGGVEEIAEKTTSFGLLDGRIKTEKISNLELFNSREGGSIASEGAQFFTISTERNYSSYASLDDVEIFNSVSDKGIEGKVNSFLKKNNLTSKDIDAVFLGKDGDAEYDNYYATLQEGIFKSNLQLGFKHLSGEYQTVSGYAIWIACEMFRSQTIPEILKLNESPEEKLKHILIYNQYLGKNHALILLSAV